MIRRLLLVLPLLLVLSLQAIPLAAQSAPAEQTQGEQQPAAPGVDKSDATSPAATPERSAKEKVPPAKGKEEPIDYRTNQTADMEKDYPMPVNM